MLTIIEELHRLVDELDASATRQELHTLIDQLTEAQAGAAARRIRDWRHGIDRLGFCS
jgi:hypothetical protein